MMLRFSSASKMEAKEVSTTSRVQEFVIWHACQNMSQHAFYTEQNIPVILHKSYTTHLLKNSKKEQKHTNHAL